uniref:Protein KRI1 homolog n=1 Tax=Salarias fasciatus TaxID=181472 RepID=A0A672FI63_SALFA
MSELRINSSFAQKYDKYRQREELQRLKDRYGDQADDSDSDSSDSSSDGSEVELDPEVEKDFYRTLSLLKKKDPKIYEKDAKFYTKDEFSSEAKPSTSRTAVKPMYLKDYERRVILEREGASVWQRAASPSYVQEQLELKDSFRKFVQDSDDEDASGVSQLLTRRVKTQEEQEEEEADYLAWLRGRAELDGPEEVKDMKHLRDYWNDPELDEKERFLRDYVLNRGYCEDEQDDHRIPTYDELVQDQLKDSEEEGETFLERQEDFERSYNFRFEEPDGQQIKTYPRSIATSVRSKDERRKRKREEVKERKKKEKEQKQEQLKQLKNLKRNQITEKLQKLQELTGNRALAFSQDDLDGDFDPRQHDQLMQKLFGEEYYGQDEEEKPQFEDEDDMEEPWNWDTWTGEEREEEYVQDEEESGAAGPHCDDEDFNMDADFDPSQQTAPKKKKKKERRRAKDPPPTGKRRKTSHFAEVITQKKPVFDPQDRSFQQYLDEYYKLDYEDVIDDLPCRFRYRQVLPNDFGLSTDEILGADDKELNRWCSLKKTCMFRSEQEEMSDLKNYKIKAQNDRRKKEILEPATRGCRNPPDPLKDGQEEDEEEEEEEELLVPKKKAKHGEEPEEAEPRTSRPGPSQKPRRSGGRLLLGAGGVKIGGREFSKQRLKAYGLNPKRLYFRQLGRQKRKAQEKKDKQKKP